ncbi:MAG: hypothetical protein IKV57_03360 [Clostridia bacterium]|nr:hypothetical protein [Clostridia bacterium]
MGDPKNRAAFLRFTLKQNWQQLVFYSIVMLLTCVVPAIIGTVTILQDYSQGFRMGYTISQAGGDLFRGIAIAFAFVSCVLGVFSGMSATGYVNSRRAIHCYHSLPLTRDTLYLESGAVQCIYYLVSSLASMLIGILWIIVQTGMTGDNVGEGFLMILTGIGGYLLVFSLFQLAGTLTGTAVFRFIAAGIISFLPVLVYLMIYAGADVGMRNIMVDYYMDYNHIRFLCPAFNIYYCMALSLGETIVAGQVNSIGYTLWSIATVYGTAVFYYLLGLWLHRKRRSELSESSLIWKKLIVFVKYPVIFASGAGCAVFFYAALGSDGVWMFFGGFCGLVLSFLLMNVLISRNTKRMFSGLPGLGITALVVVLFIAILPFDLLDVNHFMYDTDQVKRIKVYYQGNTLEFTEEEQITALMPYITELSRDTTEGQYTPEDAAFINETAYYIEPAKVLNQSAKEAADILATQYSDRGVKIKADDEIPVFCWMSGKYLDDLLEDPYKNGYYTDPYYPEVVVTESAEKGYAQSYTISTNYGGDYSYSSERLEVSVYPKFGLPVHRYVRIPEISENAALFDFLQDSEQYLDSYAVLQEPDVESIDSMYVNLMGEGVSLYTESSMLKDQDDAKTYAAAAEYDRLVADLLSAASVVTPEMLDTPVLGNLEIRIGGEYRYFNLHAGMTAFWDAWLAHWEKFPDFLNRADADLAFSKNALSYYEMLRYTKYSLYEDGEEIMDWTASFHTDSYIIEADTGRALYVEADRMAEVLEQGLLSANAGDTDGQCDTRYMVVSHVYTTDAVKEGVKNILADGKTPDGYNTYFFFRKDAVPAFVTDAFAGN